MEAGIASVWLLNTKLGLLQSWLLRTLVLLCIVLVTGIAFPASFASTNLTLPGYPVPNSRARAWPVLFQPLHSRPSSCRTLVHTLTSLVARLARSALWPKSENLCANKTRLSGFCPTANHRRVAALARPWSDLLYLDKLDLFPSLELYWRHIYSRQNPCLPSLL